MREQDFSRFDISDLSDLTKDALSSFDLKLVSGHQIPRNSPKYNELMARGIEVLLECEVRFSLSSEDKLTLTYYKNQKKFDDSISERGDPQVLRMSSAQEHKDYVAVFFETEPRLAQLEVISEELPEPASPPETEKEKVARISSSFVSILDSYNLDPINQGSKISIGKPEEMKQQFKSIKQKVETWLGDKFEAEIKTGDLAVMEGWRQELLRFYEACEVLENLIEKDSL